MSDDLLRHRKSESKERISKIHYILGTLPRMDRILQYHEDMIKKKEKLGYRIGSNKSTNHSLQVDAREKIKVNEIKLDIRR